MREDFPDHDAMLTSMYAVSQDLVDSVQGVIYGGRIPPENGMSGWYIWMGEKTEDPDFFMPLHGEHLMKRYPALFELVDLPPGYAFIYDTANGYMDIWQDNSLLEELPETHNNKSSID